MIKLALCVICIGLFIFSITFRFIVLNFFQMFEIFLTCKTISCLHSTGVLCHNNESLAAGSSPAQPVRHAGW